VGQEPGLRERKKQHTRVLIAQSARSLFIEHGFDAVSVSEVARAADVSEATVYNYFPTKEDLVYYGMEAFEEALLTAVRDRAPGESVLAAFGRFATTPRGFLAARDEASAQALLEATRMIANSPALIARERQIFARYTDSLATLVAEETGAGPNDLRPRAVAAALIGLHAALIDYVRRHVGEEKPDLRRLARGLRAEGEKAVQLLENGLDRYGVKPEAPAPRGRRTGTGAAMDGLPEM
jgi:AcrR family transcriptional regulator